jgi:hypothetical protein
MQLYGTVIATVLAATDVHRSFEQICYENGYAAESYSVITQDGYVS